MPIYEYYCDKCDSKFECLIMGKDKPKCPHCGGTKAKRMMSACGFVSKGNGGQTTAKSSGGSSCSGCSSSSCSTCH